MYCIYDRTGTQSAGGAGEHGGLQVQSVYKSRQNNSLQSILHFDSDEYRLECAVGELLAPFAQLVARLSQQCIQGGVGAATVLQCIHHASRSASGQL